MELPHSRIQLLRGATASRCRESSIPSSKLEWKNAASSKQASPVSRPGVKGETPEDGKRAPLVLPRSSSFDINSLIRPQVRLPLIGSLWGRYIALSG